MLKDYGVYKLNFAGGEPMLNKNLGDYIKFSKSIGLKTSMITNATRLTKKWLNEHGSSIDQIGISCDSLNDDFNKWIGRGFGQHVPKTKQAFSYINDFNDQNPEN